MWPMGYSYETVMGLFHLSPILGVFSLAWSYFIEADLPDEAIQRF